MPPAVSMSNFENQVLATPVPALIKCFSQGFLTFFFASAINAAVAPPLRISSADIHIELSPRTPNQMAAFYEARGFPAEMIELLKQQCFITVRIHNQRDDSAWLELANWSFSHAGKPLQRLHRDAWQQRWQDMNMPMSSRATFRWTLLPESLDYLPDEEEGGNIILPRVDGGIVLHAEFKTGADKRGPVITIDSPEFSCAENP